MNIPDEIIIAGCILLVIMCVTYIFDLRFKVQQQEKRIDWLNEAYHEYLHKWSNAQVELTKKKRDGEE